LAIQLYKTDLPDGLKLGPVVAIDTETMGLDPRRDRLCVVQLSDGSGDAHLVQIAKGQTRAPNLERLLSDPATLKLFHFGRFDIAVLKQAFGVTAGPVWCTKIASKLIRTFTTGTASSIFSPISWASMSRNSSRPATGARKS
jgi:ribonuclease D